MSHDATSAESNESDGILRCNGSLRLRRKKLAISRSRAAQFCSLLASRLGQSREA
jgi:hypothetical protein